MRGHRDLRRAGALAVACALLALLAPVGWLSLLFLAPLAFFLPGYAILAATFAERPPKLPLLLSLSLGLSLATLAIGGLLLNLLPGGIRAGSWAALLTLVVLAAARAAAIRRGARGEWRLRPAPIRLRRPSGAGLGLIAAGALATLAALVLTFTTVGGSNAIGYTELWMQPLRGREEAALRVGVGSEEQGRVRYRLLARFGDGSERTTAFALEPGETRIVRWEVARAPGSPPQRVDVSLFRKDRSARPYRRVFGWLPPPSTPR